MDVKLFHNQSIKIAGARTYRDAEFVLQLLTHMLRYTQVRETEATKIGTKTKTWISPLPHAPIRFIPLQIDMLTSSFELFFHLNQAVFYTLFSQSYPEYLVRPATDDYKAVRCSIRKNKAIPLSMNIFPESINISSKSFSRIAQGKDFLLQFIRKHFKVLCMGRSSKNPNDYSSIPNGDHGEDWF